MHKFISYTQRLGNTKLNKQYTKFVELPKKLNVNILFTDVATEMPTYEIFLKDILSNRRKLKDETMTLTEKFSVKVMNKLPQSYKTLIVLLYHAPLIISNLLMLCAI
jgi:hypothetical protein